MKVAFATTTDDVLNGEDSDRPFHEDVFARAGATLDHCVWWDPSVAWGDYDLVVIRSPWDYVERLSEFRLWLRALDPLGTLQNPAAVVEWNLDKNYLLDLAARGIPITPTDVARTAFEVTRALGSMDGEVVVKPVVSAGSRQTGRFAHDDPLASSLARQILAGGIPVMIQPCVSSVTTSGETGAIVFNGSISHAVRKGPILAAGGGFLGGAYRESITPTSLSVRQQNVVNDTLAVLKDLTEERFGLKAPLLYARIDLVTLDDGDEAVLEVELAEPTLFLSTDAESAGRFLVAVEEHVHPARER